jgi:PKHD-type hydroxylase
MEPRLDDPIVRGWSERIQRQLKAIPSFISNVLPAKICPPLFSRYTAGQHYGPHNDAALMDLSSAQLGWMRCDLAATLFLSKRQDYEGGELSIEDRFNISKIKLPAGDMMVYPACTRHWVEPVANGSRIVSYFWIQSLVSDERQRQLLYDFDNVIMELSSCAPARKSSKQLLGVYHNLLRMWSAT